VIKQTAAAVIVMYLKVNRVPTMSLAAKSNTFHAGCMDAPCTLTGDRVSLTDIEGVTHEIPTAICTCNVRDGESGGTLGGQCSMENCSAIWSTANDHADGVLTIVPQCSESN